MDHKWSLEHLRLVTDQLRKKWDSHIPEPYVYGVNDAKDKDMGQVRRGWIFFRDINVSAYAYRGEGNRDAILMQVDKLIGTVLEPPIFKFFKRRAFYRIFKDLKKINLEMQLGKDHDPEKIICNVFPEIFERHLHGKND